MKILMIMNLPTKTNTMSRAISSLRSSLFRHLVALWLPFSVRYIYIYESSSSITGVNNDRRIMYFGDSSFSEK